MIRLSFPLTHPFILLSFCYLNGRCGPPVIDLWHEQGGKNRNCFKLLRFLEIICSQSIIQPLKFDSICHAAIDNCHPQLQERHGYL